MHRTDSGSNTNDTALNTRTIYIIDPNKIICGATQLVIPQVIERTIIRNQPDVGE
jgi:hypothetical protein